MTRSRVKVTLTAGDIIRISRVVYAATSEYREVLGEKSGLPWEIAGDQVKNEVELAVRLIIARRVKQPADLHERWRDAMVKDGWRWGLVLRADEKRHPAILEFKELPVLQQAKYTLIVNLVQTLELAYAAHRMTDGGS